MQACHLSVRDLACRRGDRILFHGLHFEIGSGDVLRIAGPNGVGKSSLMRICAGLLRPYNGEVSRDGTIGLLDERPALDPQLPLGEALAFWAELDGGPFSHEMPETFGIGELLDIPFRYLSTGQRKRAAFARLIQQNAAIWLLDEPLNGLDGPAQNVIVGAIADHCRDGGLSVVASHQPIALPGDRTVALTDFIQ